MHCVFDDEKGVIFNEFDIMYCEILQHTGLSNATKGIS